MNRPGDAELPVRTRAALLDALEALEGQLDALIVIGAQALYMHAGEADVAIPPETKDADLSVDRERLQDEPLLDEALAAAGFHRDLEHPQPGGWFNPDGIPVDLMIAEAMAGPGARERRGARVPPHGRGSMRRARGFEASIVDNDRVEIGAMGDSGDKRSFQARVAGPGALLVAKLHKIGERSENPTRLQDKDAHDLYRLLVSVQTPALAETVQRLLDHSFSRGVTEQALSHFERLFAAGPAALGSEMAGRAEAGVGSPDVVSASAAALAADLLEAIGRSSDWVERS
jgi:hypothetical protein